MEEHQSVPGGEALSRRAFIRVAGGAAAATGAGVLLAACGGTAAPASSGGAVAPASASASSAASVSAAASAATTSSASGSAVPGAVTSKAASVLPAYIKPTLASKPDYDAHDPRVTLAWNNYPKNPPKSWNKPAPGTGSKVTAFVVDYYPAPTPYDSNPTWKAVNKALNSDFQMQQIGTALDYPLKMATMMASNDIPDIIHLFFGLTSIFPPPGTAEFIQSQCQDLGPFLAGNNIKDYPNLAAIPTYAWANSACVINGVLYGWPIHRYLPGLSYFFKNTDMWNKKIGANVAPKDATDLKKILTELNDPKNNVYAIGNQLNQNVGVLGYAMMFGAPYNWGLDSSGKVVRDRETPEYKAAVGYLADLWKSGLITPSVSNTSFNSRNDFVAKKLAMSVEGFGNSWNDFWYRGLKTENPPTNFDIIFPFSADSKTKVQSFNTGGYISTNVMKKASPDRVREILRIVDYLAKPFGTQEDLLISYGLSPADYSIGADGNPVLTGGGKSRSQYVPWQYISDRPYATYYAGIPNYAKHVNEVEVKLVDPKIAVSDVTLGFFSPTDTSSKGKQAQQKFSDGLNSIIVGRRPFSDYDQLVKDWQSSVGDTVKGEFNDAIAKAK